MAYETGGLESRAKNVDEKKDKIALFDEEQVYHWDELKNKVIGEKFSVIKNFFDNSSDRGKAFITSF
jgi:CRISPR-associated protein Csm1